MTAKAAMKELWDSQYKPIPQATPISVAELAAESQRMKDSNLVEHTFTVTVCYCGRWTTPLTAKQQRYMNCGFECVTLITYG